MSNDPFAELKKTHKQCACCKIWKFPNSFPPRNKKGTLASYCYDCGRLKGKDYRSKLEKDAERKQRRLQNNRKLMAAKRADPSFVEYHNPEYRKTYSDKHPDQRRIYARIAHHIKKGNIIPLPCMVCGDKKSEAHHEDYSKPFDLMWLCRSHHREIHRKDSDLVQRFNLKPITHQVRTYKERKK